MTVIIDGTGGVNIASTTGIINLFGSTSGTLTLQANAVAGTNTLTLPNNTGILLSNASVFSGTGPAFRAGLSSTQSISANTATKIQFNSETFDTNNNYDNTTNYRFTPTVAGYYQVNAMAQLLSTASTVFFTMIYKNGSNYQRLGALYGSASEFGSSGSALVYCNGSTDYIEVYAYISGTSPSVYGEVVITSFSASMIRGA
jgi:hypothetical protein